MKSLAELCLVVLLLYVIAWFVGPEVDLYLPPRGPCGGGLNRVNQMRTVADIRNTGSTLLAWAEDREPGTKPPESVITDPRRDLDINTYRQASHEEIFSALHPSDDYFFMRKVPEFDGWGHALEFRLAGDPAAPDGVLIRSPGCDGKLEQDSYETGPFVTTDYRRDIVWADGFFVRWPGRPGDTQP